MKLCVLSVKSNDSCWEIVKSSYNKKLILNKKRNLIISKQYSKKQVRIEYFEKSKDIIQYPYKISYSLDDKYNICELKISYNIAKCLETTIINYNELIIKISKDKKLISIYTYAIDDKDLINKTILIVTNLKQVSHVR